MVGGIDSHHVGSDSNWCSAGGPKREEIGRRSAGSRTTRAGIICNVVKWDGISRIGIDNLLASASGAIPSCIERPTVTGAQCAQISAAKCRIGDGYAVVDRRAVVENSLNVTKEEELPLNDGAANASAEIVIVVGVFS